MFAFWGPQFLYENTKAHSPLKTFGLRIHLAAKPNYLEGLYISHLDWIFCLAAEKLSVWWLFSGPLTIWVWAVQIHLYRFFFNSSGQFSSVAQSFLTLCNPMDCSTPGFPVHQQLPELAQTHIQWVGDAIQPSHPLLSPSPPAFSLSQHQSLFKWVSSLHQVAKVL